MKQASPIPGRPLALWVVGLALVSWLFALQGIVTFPVALLTGALAALALFPLTSAVFSRRWAVAIGLSIAALLLTVAWQRAWS